MSRVRGSTGATKGVQRALGWDGGDERARHDQALCSCCRAELRFLLGEFGQTLEICDTRGCPNSIPHRPRPDLSAARRRR